MNCARMLVVSLFVAVRWASGQDNAPPPVQEPPAARAAPTEGAKPPAADQPPFKQEELEQMLAPIALYPDSLIAQILMAATYPIEVVEAERWVLSNRELTGDALAAELDKKTWDESVKSLCGFPQVLSTMSQNLSTTLRIGDAMIGQPKDVMATIQKLRAKAQSAGNLESTPEQTVSTQVVEGGTQVIVVESASPDVVYVPQYSPTVVYGAWPYPAYPPYPYYPPGYTAGAAAVSFGVGMAVGACWSNAWGDCDWHGGDINIDSNRNVNRNIDRNRSANRQQGSFKHNPSHRQGAAYRNQSSASRVGAGQTSARAAATRTEYRGRADAARADLAPGAAGSLRGNAGPGRENTRPLPGARDGQAVQRASAGQRPNPSSSYRGGALNDARAGGPAARAASTRGSVSRSSSPARSVSTVPRGGGGARAGGARGGGRR